MVPLVAAIILAAGDSTRMGRPKALLADPDGRPFVARLVRTCAASGCPTIVVVTGRDHAAVAEALVGDRLPVDPVVVNNPAPSRGQLSSLWIGLDAASSSDTEAALVTLVDVPMVRPSTVRQVIDAWRQSRAPVVRPALGDRHGHPVLFDRTVFDELRRAPLAEGAKAVVRAHADRVVNVPVDDEGCVMDVDTPDEYEAMQRGRLR
jgi:molybdenum cofactor cytidylyltransferase